MTPDEYRDTLNRLQLKHTEAAELLDIHPITSVKAVVGPRIARLLMMIEHVGVEKYRKIVGLSPPPAQEGSPSRRGGAGSRTPARQSDRPYKQAASVAR